LSELDKPFFAGLSLGIAILLKTSPALFIIYFLIIRRYRVVLVTLATVLLLTLLSQVPFPTNIVEHFLSIIPKLSNEIHPTPYNQSISSIAFRLLSGLPPSDLNTIIPFINKTILGVLISVLVWYGWRSACQSRYARMWLFACFQILAVIFSPLVWYHHYVFLLFPLLLLLSDSSSLARVVGILVLTSFQVLRYFESIVVWFPWPALFGILMLLLSAYILFIRASRNRNLSESHPPNLSL
jgi:alpha-1,2-mannosyltransferase